jgi:two-component system, sensor histidine kinase and response regulator
LQIGRPSDRQDQTASLFPALHPDNLAMQHILVIDDELQLRNNIQEILTLHDFQASVASNGQMGVELAQTTFPDLIVCDVTMPVLDGYGVLETLRAQESTAHIPLIFLTGEADRPHQRLGMELGANDYLTKPFTPEELLLAIQTQLRQQDIAQWRSDVQLNQLRNSISTALPHELNTPLNGILGSAQLLIHDHGMIPPDEALELAQSIYESALRLHRLTRNYLLYTELELLNSHPIDCQAFRHARCWAPEAIGQAATRSAEKANRNGDLCLFLPELELPMSALKLGKIVEELTDNAFKFSANRSPVQVLGEVREDAGQGRVFNLTVVNAGPGMTDAQIRSLGGYVQFDRQRREQQGSGLGLIIARRLIELHGGTLKIDSVPQQHTSVTLALPL